MSALRAFHNPKRMTSTIGHLRFLGTAAAILFFVSSSVCNCFITSRESFVSPSSFLPGRLKYLPGLSPGGGRLSSSLSMGLDPVTFLRTEFVSAALFTNQIPRSADTCLQLGVYDGRAVTFIPKTIRQFHTSSVELDGVVSIGIQRALQQALQSRNILDSSMQLQFYDAQRADNLTMIPNDTIDVVISMQSAEKMQSNGLDWKRSVQEAIRVLKPGGRFLFVEQTDIGSENYLDYVGSYASNSTSMVLEQQGKVEKVEERFPMLDCVGWDNVDFVLTPHVAGVFTKRLDAGMTKQERIAAEKLREKDILAERSLSVFEGRRKKKIKKDEPAKK